MVRRIGLDKSFLDSFASHRCTIRTLMKTDRTDVASFDQDGVHAVYVRRTNGPQAIKGRREIWQALRLDSSHWRPFVRYRGCASLLDSC